MEKGIKNEMLKNYISKMKRRAGGMIAMMIVIALVASNMTNTAQAAAGDLDASFGAGGKVTTNILFDFNTAQDVAIQADGKIVVAGFASNGPLSSDFALARYNTNGSLDPNFGTGGIVTTDFFNADDQGSAVAIQADGKIVVTGSVSNGTDIDFGLARYDTNGNLDPNFGSGGIVTTDVIDRFSDGVQSGSTDIADAIAIQPDGKIVVVGSTSSSPISSRDFALARYTTGGSLDSNFGSFGIVITDILAGSSDSAFAVALQSDGQIVAAGTALTNPNIGDFALARYDAFGNLDPNFGSGGKVLTDFSGNSDVASAIAIQGDGRIVVAGSTSAGIGVADFALARYEANGNPDPGFGSGGKTTTDFFGHNDFIGGVVLQADGFIVVAGNAVKSDLMSDFALARYNTAGGLDPGFGTGGKVTTDFFNSFEGASSVAIQADGKIVAAGGASNTGSNSQADFALARYSGEQGTVYNICVQDDSTRSTLRFNSTTGDYLFTRCGNGGLTVGGKGTVTVKGCSIILQQTSGNGRVTSKVDTCTKKATASLQLASGSYTLTDRNTTDNTCACPQ